MPEPTVIRGRHQSVHRATAGVLARVLVDPTSCEGVNLALGVVSFESGAGVTPHTRSGQEFVYVTEGIATVLVGATRHALWAGDAIYLPAGTEHQHMNDSDAVCRFLFAFSPPGPEETIRTWPVVDPAE